MTLSEPLRDFTRVLDDLTTRELAVLKRAFRP